jgi:hypothetical protein
MQATTTELVVVKLLGDDEKRRLPVAPVSSVIVVEVVEQG